MNSQETEQDSSEDFPFPKMLRAFNYFFPKTEGTHDLFTMWNFRKFYRFAPLWTWIIFVLIFVMWVRDGFGLEKYEDSWVFLICGVSDAIFLVVAFIHYVWWLGGAVVAKVVRRSPMVPLWMSFFDPLRYFFGFCFIQVLGFIGRMLGNFVL